MADANRSQLSYIEEDTPGETPSGALTEMPRTGGSINPENATTESEIIRPDLRPTAPVRTAQHGSGTINVELRYGDLDDIFRGLLLADWQTDEPAAGTDRLEDDTERKTFTFQDAALDQDLYEIYRGCMIEQVDLSFALRDRVTGSFQVMAMSADVQATSLDTVNDAPGEETINTVDMISAIEEGGSAIGAITGIDLQLQRALRRRGELGELSDRDLGLGRLTPSGTIRQYFESDDLLQEFLAFSDRSLKIVVQDTAGNELTFEIPNLKYTGQPNINRPGPDDDVIAEFSFQGFTDGDSPVIRIDRTAA